MKLHVFNDPHGFILDLAVKRIGMYGQEGHHLFINLTDQTIYRNEKVIYLKRNRSAFKKAIRKLPNIDCLIFSPLDYTAAWFLHEFNNVRPTVPVAWVFWSYEYYHRPDIYQTNLDSYSLSRYLQSRTFFKRGSGVLKNSVKRLLGIPVFNQPLMNRSYQLVHDFFSFLPKDFKTVFHSVPGNEYKYHPISFLSIGEISQGIDSSRRNLSNEIMIGHSAALSGNHVEAIERLASLNIPHRFFIPLEYGDAEYAKDIIVKAEKLIGAERIEFHTRRLEMPVYYQRLARIGFAVFNFRYQEGLGNILFLIWNGTKVFLNKNSSVYQQFDQWGIKVFSIEEELTETNLSSFLVEEEADNNRRVLESLFSDTQVSEYWKEFVSWTNKEPLSDGK